MKRTRTLRRHRGQKADTWFRIASLSLMAMIAAGAGGCSSSSGLPNRTDAGEAGGPDVGPDVARDLGGSPDLAMDAPTDLPMEAPPDLRTEVASQETGGTDALDGGDGICHLPIDGPLPFTCASTFDDPSWRKGICDSPVPFRPAILERICGGFQSRSFDYGTHRWICYYDPTTLALVGGEFADDIPSYCNRTIPYAVAGDIPPDGCRGVFGQAPPCGADGGGQ